MPFYDLINRFFVSFVYEKKLYEATIERIQYLNYKPHQSFRVIYKNHEDNSTGTISHLVYDPQKNVWDDPDFIDKELCKTVGKRIADYYFGELVLKQ